MVIAVRLWTHGTAEYSPCRRYRYVLTRAMNPEVIGDDTRTIAFVGLNPSTATATTDDPTVRRCIGYAAREGFGRFVMLNAFAYRATDPADMKACPEPVGPGNDAAILRVVGEADLVVFAWGAHGGHLGRHDALLELVGPRHCLGVTKGGFPRHPLYLRRDAAIVPYAGAVGAV